MQTLQAELDSLKLNSGSEAKQQEPNGAAGDSPSMEALLQLRRQISAYQVPFQTSSNACALQQRRAIDNVCHQLFDWTGVSLNNWGTGH